MTPLTITKQHAAAGLRMVALLEGAKGALVMLAGFGLLTLLHRDVHEAAVELVQVLHLNPARHLPTIFLDLAGRVTDKQLWAMAAAALLYAVIRLVEAAGLWMQRRWAAWFGLLSGGMYIPVEIYEVMEKASWPRVAILLVNLIIVLYLARELLSSTAPFTKN